VTKSVSKKNLIVQHNKIIEARYKLSVGEQRLIKVLVSMIKSDDEDFKTYSIAVSDLVSLLEIKGGDTYNSVKLATKKLIGNVLIFDDGVETIQTSWLSVAHYKKGSGQVDLQFSPILKPFLLHLKNHFTSYELGNVINLKHIYSIRIYELLKQYESIGKRSFLVDDLRKILMVGDEEYRQFCDFRRWILKPAQIELKEKTDIVFSWNEARKNQKCVSLDFFIEKNNAVLLSEYFIELQQVEFISESLSNSILVKLIDIGVGKRIAQKIVKDYDEKRIESAIAYCESQRKEGKIKNPGGFIVEAIKNEYRDNKAEERERKQKAKKAVEEKEKRDKELKEKQALQKKEAVEGYLRSLTQDKFIALEAEFVEENKANVVVMQRYNKEGLKNPLVNGCFGEFVFNRLSQLRGANA
jgi:plasmid replication initiation protein